MMVPLSRHLAESRFSGILHRGLGYAAYLKPNRYGAILNFHSVRDVRASDFAWRRRLSVSPRFLERLIKELRRQDIAIVSLAEALRRIRSGDSKAFVAFTFDDGYADNFDAGFEIFRRYDAPFAIFLTTGFIDRTVPMWWSVLETLLRENDRIVLPHATLPAANRGQKAAALEFALNFFRGVKPAEIGSLVGALIARNPRSPAREEAFDKPLTWSQVREMARSGLVTFGCHTVSHPVLHCLDRDGMEREIRVARERIVEELGAPPAYFAYPYGGAADIGTDAQDVVAGAGFEAAFTTRRAPLSEAALAVPYMLPRISFSGLHQHRTALRAYLLMAEQGW